MRDTRFHDKYHNGQQNVVQRLQTPSPFGTANPPSWTLSLWGRVVDAPLEAIELTTAANGGAAPPTAPHPAHPFTWYLQNLTIRLPSEDFPDNNVIEWRRESVGEGFTDRLQLRRVGNKPVEVEVVFEPYTGLALQTYDGVAVVVGLTHMLLDTMCTVTC